jgi:hypothetical protein
MTGYLLLLLLSIKVLPVADYGDGAGIRQAPSQSVNELQLKRFSEVVDALKLRVYGEGSYNWWGIKIYDARLLTLSNFNSDFMSVKPIALEIRYDMDIDSEDLIKTTKEEWNRLQLVKESKCDERNQWLQELSAIWPDLNEGDRLQFLLATSGESMFFFNGQFIGKISDSHFGGCFLAIWLAADSSASKLRQQLLAGKSD